MSNLGMTVGLIKALAPAPEIDPEQVKQDVEDWLDDHPEATTTVQDGAITKAKLNASLQGTVDDVDALKSAFDSISITYSNIFNVNDGEAGYYNNSKELAITPDTLKHVNIPVSTGDIIRFTVDTTNISVYNIGNVLNSEKTSIAIIRNGTAYASYTAYSTYYEVTILHNDAKYLAITYSTVSQDAFMITKNASYPSNYVPYGTFIDTTKIQEKTINAEQTNFAVSDFTPILTTGKYVVSTDGTESSLASASCSDYIDILNVTDVYTALSQYVGICFYDYEKTYISGFDDTVGVAKWYSLNPPAGTKYVRISNRTNTLSNSDVICRKAINKAIDFLQADSASPINNIGSMFQKSIHIGDSLTYSQVYTASNTQRQAYQTYPDVFGKLCGSNASLIATPGAMPSTWWGEYSSQITEHGLYIVFLGTNGGLTDTVDTDCVGDDITQYATTETGYYGRILQTIKANNDVAVLIKCFGGGGDSLSVTNQAIESLGTRYSCPVIDINDSERTNIYYHYYPNKSGNNKLHFNDLGYNWMANVVFRKINELPLDKLWLIYPKQ